jgi:ABC-type sugar transport system permease subunit
MVLPIVAELPLAFSNWNGVSSLSTIRLVGLGNFRLLFHDPEFNAALVHNLVFTAVTAVTTLVLAVAVALLLEQTRLFRGFLRTVLFLPAVLPIVVVAFIWEWVYAPDIGILNAFLNDVGLHSLTTAWIGNAHTAFGAIIVVQDWAAVPFFMVIVLAGLQTVPLELEEAAELDGAHYVQRLRYVVIPHLRPVLTVVGALLVFWGFQQFLNVYVMTAGGPGFYSTQVLAVYIYQLAFLYDRFGYAAAVAIVLLLISIATGLVYFRVTRFGRPQEQLN